MTVSGTPLSPVRRLPAPSPRRAARRSAASTLAAALALPVAVAVAAAPALAQGDEVLGVSPGDVDITLSAAGETTITDNVGGAGGSLTGFGGTGGGGDDDEGDVITTLSGTATAIAQGARTNLAGTYTASYDQYLSQTDRSGFRQSLLGSGTYEAVDDHLFFDASASLATRFAGAGSVSATDRVGVGGQTQTLTWSVGPTWRQRVGGSFADLQASYRFSGSTFFEASSGDVGDTGRPDDGLIHTFSTGLTSGRDFDRFRWGLNGSWQTQTESDDEDNGDTTRRSVEASTEYRIDRRFGLLGSVGYDDVDLADPSEGVTSEEDLSGAFWTAGLRFNPSPRTDMRAEYGRRYNEPFYRGSVNWRITERTSLSASYDTEVTTLQESLLTGVSPQCLAGALRGVLNLDDPACLVDLFNTGVLGREGVDPSRAFSLVDATTRTETFRAVAVHRQERTTYTLSSSVVQREFTSDGSSDTTFSVNGQVTHALTPQTTGAILVGYTTADETVTGNEDIGLTTTDGTTSLRGRLSLSHQFADDLSGSLSYSHLRREEDTNSGTSSENALVARIAVTF